MSENHAAPGRVLLAEDDALVAVATKRWLGLRGFAVDTVGSAQEAIAWLRQHTAPDLLILDYDLGDGTAEAVLFEARHLQIASAIVLYTATHHDLLRRVAAFHRVAAVAAKPAGLSVATLWAAIESSRIATADFASNRERKEDVAVDGAEYLASRVDMIASLAGGASDLERLVLRLRLEGVPVKQLTDSTDASESTLRRKFRRLLRRLGAAGIADLDRAIAAKLGNGDHDGCRRGDAVTRR